MRKIAVIGSRGMAGHVVYNYFKENTSFEVVDIAREADLLHSPTYQLDITDFQKLEEVLKAEYPHILVNCVGALNRDAEDNPDKAVLLNSYLPHFLAKMATSLGAKLIHISTDCVFSGKTGSYTESSPKDGLGFYAQSKALGEVNYGNHLTLRTSIIGPELKKNGIGLFHWFMNQSDNIKGYRQAYWTGVTTIELAKAIVAAIEQDLCGLHHLVNGTKINKYSLTSLFNSVFEKNLTIEPFDDYKVDKSLIKTDYSFKYEVPEYDVMVNEMKEWITNHSFLYKYYN